VVPQIAHGARVVFGASVASPAGSAPVAALRTHPAYDPSSFANDAAIVVLGASVSVAAAQLATAPPATGSLLNVVGWGETAADAGDYGEKRAGAALVSAVGSLSFDATPDPSQPCEGDSGGGAFASGTGGGDLLLGITSHGDAACATGATFTRVDAVTAGFIAPTLAALGPGTAAVGARCLYPEQCKTGGAGACIAAQDQPGLSYCTVPCAVGSGCPAGMRCAFAAVGGSVCVYTAPTPGAFGGACTVDGDCYDGVCVAGVCTIRCVPTGDTCPAGATCQDHGGGIDFYCVLPPTPAPAGGCSVERRPSAGRTAVLALEALELVGLLAVARARRRRRPPW
jgi:hypothetical protein